MTTKPCGPLLHQLRTDAHLTLRRLAQLADVKHSNIALIESGKKTCGATVAVKLANALRLQDRQRLDFLLAASLTTKHPIVRKREGIAGDDLAALLKVLWVALQPEGVKPSAVTRLSASQCGKFLFVEQAQGRCLTFTLQGNPQRDFNL